METEEFEKYLEELILLAKSGQIALMCAEALPWRCHSSLIEGKVANRCLAANDLYAVNRIPMVF